MTALDPQYMAILKKVLADRFVPFLPPLLDTTKPAKEQQTKQLSRAFSAFVLHKLLDITPHSAAASVVDDFNDKGIDAVYYDEISETLYLLQSKLKESEQFKQDDALPFCEGIRLILKQEFSGFNKNFKNRRADIEAALDACSHIKLVVSYTGDGISKTAIDVLQSLLDDDDLDDERLYKRVEYYTSNEIIRDLLAEQAYPPVHTELTLQKSEKIESPRATYYGVARLSDLVTLHRTHGKALYERNIRYFLGSSKSDVNKAIKITLRDSPTEFFYLNNGVTAVCDLIEPKASKNGFKKFKIRGLSIINGAQTVASAAEFVHQNSTQSIADAKVMLTVIHASADGEFGRAVTKARNHQNPVQTANFASLDENQERLRQEIAHLGLSYHYRPEVVPTDINAITLDEALRALVLLQNDPRYVVWLKSEPGRFSDPNSTEYRELFTAALPGMVLVNTVMCHRAIRKLLVEYDQRARAGSQERLIYRHGIHALAAIIMKRLKNQINGAILLDDADIVSLISRSLDELRQSSVDIFPRHAFSGPLSFFKSQTNVIPYLAELMEIHFGLTESETVQELRRRHTEDRVYPRQKLIEYLVQNAPQLRA